MESRTVLVVDDEARWRALLRRVLAPEGYRVLAAPSCACALELARAGRPDCVVADFNLPDGTAEDICRALRAEFEPPVPVVVFSGSPEAELLVSRDALADDFVLKSAPLSELTTALRRHLA